ncbi:hypothetical protein FDP41_000486 [Naegleria fowleri]|uniref:Choline transporter-like protein n=1 Tax=Naegleria fowleri TaxID=5763 RepID=A0A6A5C5L4_NAEFO|nr:uncharacterized protein FDP41_000486 [Naegleria fowleri]KAF0984587.1 hypothetical protein FDP41_000486 [Naegleria fowleri]CAG4717968.1 unnamed protein product [Naegleria fowleri]
MKKLACCTKGEKTEEDDFDKKQIPSEYGVNRKRSCTDVLCIPVFILFWIGMFVIAGFGFWSGNPAALVEPIDYEGNMCGYAIGKGNDNIVDLRNKTYLWYPFEFRPEQIKDITTARLISALGMGICVKECPSSVVSILNPLSTAVLDSVVCKYEVNDTNPLTRAKKAYDGDGCYFNYFTHEIYFKRCIPVLDNTTMDLVTKTTFKQTMKVTNGLKQGLSEVWRSWLPILISSVLSLILCFTFVLFMRLFVGIVVRVILVVVALVMGCAGGYILYIGVKKYIESESNGVIDTTMRTASQWWMGIGGTILGLLLIYLVLMIFLWGRIRKAIAIIKEGSRAVNKFPTLIIIPAVSFLLICGLTVWWAVVAVFLQSAQKPVTIAANDPRWSEYMNEISTFMNTTKFSNTSITIDQGTTALQVLGLYNLFAYFWGVAFIEAIACTTIAGVVAGWYFGGIGNDKKTEKFSVFKSFWRVIRYHIGSMIFGSLVVAIVQMIRYLFKKAKTRLQKLAQENTVANWIIKVFDAILWVVEKIVRFMNKNAYLMIAIHGSNFLMSSSRGFMIVMENILIVGTTNTISDVVLFLGRVLITVISSVICYLIIDLNNKYEFLVAVLPVVEYGIIPSVVTGVITFLIASLFMNLYDIAIDTILICVSYELYINPNEVKGPYFMSDRLRKIYLGKLKMDRIGDFSCCCCTSQGENYDDDVKVKDRELKDEKSKDQKPAKM